ncbi:MAG: SDR family NAD(P)-dependent oxidoreductase [Actinomycetota bacterium]|nr:SDR family NAD(P)-dependent oxidoreductase [Actinomycetota bacterium]
MEHEPSASREVPAPRRRHREPRPAREGRASRAHLSATLAIFSAQSVSGERGVAVVTGASSGIGEAVARALTVRGWRCVLVARREQRLRRLAEQLGGEYEVCDVGDREAVERMAAAVRERHPVISLLVNNAGMPARGSFETVDAERIEQVTRVNYLGGVWCTRGLLPALEAGRPSHLVNVVSVAGTVASGRAGPYTAAKHAQLAFSRSLAAQLHSRGISVHTVNPGFVETEGFPQRGRLRSRLLERLVLDPPVVADAVVRAIERDRREIFVPRWYRGAAIVQALVPGLVARFAGATGYRESET